MFVFHQFVLPVASYVLMVFPVMNADMEPSGTPNHWFAPVSQTSTQSIPCKHLLINIIFLTFIRRTMF